MIKHGDLRCVRNEGMPIYKAPLEKGTLIIQFLVSSRWWSWAVLGMPPWEGQLLPSSTSPSTGHLP